jgi:hypothetical protein
MKKYNRYRINLTYPIKMSESKHQLTHEQSSEGEGLIRQKRRGGELDENPIKKSKEEVVESELDKAIRGLQRIKELQTKIVRQEHMIQHLRSL